MNRRGFLKSMAVAVPALLVLPSAVSLIASVTEEHPLLGGTTATLACSGTVTPLTLANCKAAVEKVMQLEYVPECIYMHPDQREAFEREMKEMKMDYLNSLGFVPYRSHAMVPRGVGYKIKFPTPGNYKLKFQDRL